MARNNAAKKEAANDSNENVVVDKPKKPILLILLVIVNMLAVIGVGAIVYLGQQKKEAKESPLGESENLKLKEIVSKEKAKAKVISLDTFLINLIGDRGRKLVKVNMELELSGDGILDEVTKLKPRVRDMIITIISSKVYKDISTKDGKENLRNEIKDQINLFLTKGKIDKVFFTQFVYGG